MKYLDKVKASDVIKKAIDQLGHGEDVRVIYGKDYKGNDQVYAIRCYVYTDGERSYSIADAEYAFQSMNIDSLTNTQAKAYTFDLMRNKTTYNFPLYQMKLA